VPRLEDPQSGVTLIAASLPHLDAEETSAACLCKLLGVDQPPAWPPEFMDGDVLAWFRTMLLEDEGHSGWLNYYVIAPVRKRHVLAGCAGFKGKPDEKGWVEIGYTVLPGFRRQGLASAAVRLLAAHAFSHTNVTRIRAETLPDRQASLGVLARSGFVADGQSDDGKILHFALCREAP
jgi:[ribosomal protein S5]-alanine N-acetyltransferase